METRIIIQTEEKIDENALNEAGEIIRRGGLVAFPTETVYGLGGDALNPESSKKIYEAKGRPSDNPLIVHIARMEDLAPLVLEVPAVGKALAERFWPGPLTLIFPKSDLVPKETTGGLDTVAVRYPSHKVAQEFIRRAGGYVAAPSANLSGKPSPTLAKYVLEDMSGRIDLIIDGGDIPIGLESTIVDVTGEVPVVLRPGYITKEMIEDVVGCVDMDRTILDGDSADRPKAPGMKYRHYAPKGELVLVSGLDTQAVAEEINFLLEKAVKEGKKTGVLATEETAYLYHADVVKILGSREHAEEIGASLYRLLREMDDEKVACIYSESFESTGFGQAIMNRLFKAAGHKIIHIGEGKV